METATVSDEKSTARQIIRRYGFGQGWQRVAEIAFDFPPRHPSRKFWASVLEEMNQEQESTR